MKFALIAFFLFLQAQALTNEGCNIETQIKELNPRADFNNYSQCKGPYDKSKLLNYNQLRNKLTYFKDVKIQLEENLNSPYYKSKARELIKKFIPFVQEDINDFSTLLKPFGHEPGDYEFKEIISTVEHKENYDRISLDCRERVNGNCTYYHIVSTFDGLDQLVLRYKHDDNINKKMIRFIKKQQRKSYYWTLPSDSIFEFAPLPVMAGYGMLNVPGAVILSPFSGVIYAVGGVSWAVETGFYVFKKKSHRILKKFLSGEKQVLGEGRFIRNIENDILTWLEMAYTSSK